MSTANEYAREWRRKNPERSKAYWDKYHAEHPDAARKAVDKYQALHPDAVRATWRRKARFTDRGLTPEWYRDQLVGQAGRCAICWLVFASDKETHIDHDHETGQVRGLLCRSCNTMLGFAKDSSAILESASKYLKGVSIHVHEDR